MGDFDNVVKLERVFNQGTTVLVLVGFNDDQGVPVVPAAAKYTLYDRLSGSTINSRSNVPIVTSAATALIELTPADNPIVDPENATEDHRLYVEYTYNGSGTRTGSLEIQIPVLWVALKEGL